jgi:hypothetical protein
MVEFTFYLPLDHGIALLRGPIKLSLIAKDDPTSLVFAISCLETGATTYTLGLFPEPIDPLVCMRNSYIPVSSRALRIVASQQ